MSILIKGMEMPKSCYACMFFAQTDYWNKEDEADILSRCKRTGEKTWESVNGYLPNCPLVPVPPHGRLIDADAMIEKYNSLPNRYDRSMVGMISNYDLFDALVYDLQKEPTIIPAEEGE